MSILRVNTIQNETGTTAATIDNSGNTALSGNLKVNTIQDSTGTTGLTIDSSGRVSRSVLPSFFVYGAADWYDFGNTYTQVFKTGTHGVTTAYNNGSIYDASTGNVTASMAGLWQFQCNIYSGNTGDVQNPFRPYRNGSVYANMAAYVVSPTNDTYPDNTATLSWCMELSASDTVAIFMKEDFYANHSNWSGFFVG